MTVLKNQTSLLCPTIRVCSEIDDSALVFLFDVIYYLLKVVSHSRAIFVLCSGLVEFKSDRLSTNGKIGLIHTQLLWTATLGLQTIFAKASTMRKIYYFETMESCVWSIATILW